MVFEILNRWDRTVIYTGEGETLAAVLTQAVSSGANLRNADLRGASLRNADLYGASLSGADLYGASLSGANLRNADLGGADLSGANLRNADLRGANLGNANLRGASLSGADLYGASLSGAYLSGADLSGANLSGANLGNADLGNANLGNANLGNALNYTPPIQAQPAPVAQTVNIRVENMPNTRNMSFLAWSRQYVKWRMRAYARTRPQALADMRRSVTHRDETWTFTRCVSCERPVVNNPELSGEGIFACQACGRCIDDCSCVWCARCGDECSDDSCGECSRCRSCCDCVRCDNCGEQTSDRCSGCGRGDCCDCVCRDEDQPAQVRFFESPLKFWDSKLHERKLNPSPRYVAAEIEVASVKRGNTTSDVVKQWSGSIVHDGSLPGGGFEINTAPAGGDLFMRQIAEICASLNDKGARVTKECGLHVHINAKDFDYYALRRLVKAYAKIEDALYTMVAPSRRQSRYCIPCGAKYLETMGAGKVPKDVKIGVLKSVYTFKENCKYGGRDLQESKRHKYHEARYNALNIHSWFYRGTVECRMFNGSTNADKIQSWGMMWAHILDYVAGKSDKEVDADLANLSSVEALLRIVEASPARARLSAFVKERIAKLGSE